MSTASESARDVVFSRTTVNSVFGDVSPGSMAFPVGADTLNFSDVPTASGTFSSTIVVVSASVLTGTVCPVPSDTSAENFASISFGNADAVPV